MNVIWKIGKGFFKVIWQLIRMTIIIADTVLNGMPEPSKKYKPYTEAEAQDLFYKGKITIDELHECIED